jgi:voltage-gated potassium channel
VESGTIVLPRPEASPFRSAVRRMLLAVLALLVIATVVWLDGDGYSDIDGEVSYLDALYYATVSASTTGYGDIAPVTDQARLVNVVLVTPLRVLFVVALIGSVFEVVTATARKVLRQRRFERTLQGHIVVVGYGTRGRAAVRALVEKGHQPDRIVAIDRDQAAVDDAVDRGVAAVQGDATRDSVQNAASVADAATVIVAVSEDATSVLATLTSRRLSGTARIISSVREAENAPLLHDSGADSVVVSSETAGRLLGVAVSHPPAANVLTDLLAPDCDLKMLERPVEPREVGRLPRACDDLVLAVVRDGRQLAYHDDAVGTLQPDDTLVVVHLREA